MPDLWIFAYGSLMWKPGFDVVESVRARIDDYRRSFCMWSIHHRGTPEAPGLVLALDPAPGGECQGMALRVADHNADDVLAYLRERELISSAYVEVRHPVALADGRAVEAVVFVMDQGHDQYTGPLGAQEQAEVIARSRGGMGPNDEYLYATVAHLHELGCPDPELEEVAALVRSMNAARA